MALRESGEMYLETIYILTEKNHHVHSIDVCEYMGFSKPSVSRAIGLLRAGGYVNMDREGHLTLTDIGLEMARKIYDRHRILTEFFISLGVTEGTASDDACRVEHVISDETFDVIKNSVDTKKQ